MTTLLHQAKLYQPPLPAHTLPRPRLLNRWPELLQQPLTLICAPAGFGKTTLAVAWIEQLHQHSPAPHVAWLALDEADNDPQRFWQYLLAAVQRHLPHVGQAAHALLAAGQTANPTAVVTTILNDLFAQPPHCPLAHCAR
jgi:LuxR family transcriptional regulator, maltose regulon positive regulatory protein